MKYLNHYFSVIVLIVVYLIYTYSTINSTLDAEQWFRTLGLSLDAYAIITIGYLAYAWKCKNGIIWGGATLVMLIFIEALLMMNSNINELSTLNEKSVISIMAAVTTLILMTIILLALPNRKKCPNCAELVKKEAKLCKYCNSEITS
jgi:phosphatidylserine synthase